MAVQDGSSQFFSTWDQIQKMLMPESHPQRSWSNWFGMGMGTKMVLSPSGHSKVQPGLEATDTGRYKKCNFGEFPLEPLL